MAHIAGGFVEIGTKVAGIKSWTLDHTRPELDTTDFGDAGYYTCIAGYPIKGSGTFEGYKDGVYKTIKTGVKVVLTLNEGPAATTYWLGDAFILGQHITASFDGIVTISYDFTYTGEITVPTE